MTTNPVHPINTNQNTTSSWLKGWPKYLGSILVVGLGYLIFSTIGGALGSAMGLPIPAMAADMDPTASLISGLVGGLILGLAFAPLTSRLPVPFWERAGLLFIITFTLGTVINIIEALFFTTMTFSELALGLLSAGASTLAAALLLAWLFPPAAVRTTTIQALKTMFTQRPWSAWIWRIGLAGVLYLPTYFVFGLLVSPIVVPFYDNPDLGLALTIPSFSLILPLEIGRGLIYVLVLLPLIAVLPASRRSLALWLWLVIVVLGAVMPMMANPLFPMTLRLVHGLEITGDALVQGVTIAWLVGGKWGTPHDE